MGHKENVRMGTSNFGHLLFFYGHEYNEKSSRKVKLSRVNIKQDGHKVSPQVSSGRLYSFLDYCDEIPDMKESNIMDRRFNLQVMDQLKKSLAESRSIILLTVEGRFRNTTASFLLG